MNNYPTKFALREKVKVVSGLNRGSIGKITGYLPHSTVGMGDDIINRKMPLPSSGLYIVKIGLFTSIYVMENQLELV